MGGLKQYFFNLFGELLEHDLENEYIFFYFFPHNLEELANLESARWEANTVLLKDQLEVRRHLDKVDLYFCPFGALWPRPLSIPTVVTLVDIQEVFYPQFFTALDMYNREYHFPGSTRMADRVITISDSSKQTIVKHHRISARKVAVSHLCADKRYYRAAEVAQAPDCPLPEGDFVIYPANYWMHKNHDTLLKALQWLKEEKGLKVVSVFTGYDVPNGYSLTQKAAEYGLSEQVYQAGYVTVEELAYLYSRAKMLVFPSLFEGFGIPLVEAMAAGCPIVVADATSLPEIGKDAAEYFDPSSPESIGLAIQKVWYDGELGRQLIERGKRRSLDFSAAKLARTHVDVFKEAAQAFSRARYLWHRWVYQHYHRKLINLKYREVLQR
jgi:glycosyltransferase involved in cell wall biosynthesis